MKVRKSVTLDSELITWIQEEIKGKRFASISHAIEYALQKLKDQE